MDQNFTDEIKEWLETPDEQRDYQLGATILLRLTGNRVMYRNIAFNPNARARFITAQIKKYYDFRLARLTHEQVLQMQNDVDKIVEEHKQQINLADKAEQTDASDRENRITGKRDDHDILPDDIKALYIENLSLLRKIRELHFKLRTLTLDNSACPDSERYPFLKEIIALDKKYHDNWNAYDHYVISQDSDNTQDGGQTKVDEQQNDSETT